MNEDIDNSYEERRGDNRQVAAATFLKSSMKNH